jgi:fermentation-respiration switch protein FrsA (DUF1100 family)
MSLASFDFSGCGHSEGPFITLGINESDDLLDIVQFLSSKGVDKVVLWGRSMGAVSVLEYLRKGGRAEAAILDSPFSSLPQLIKEILDGNANFIPEVIKKSAIQLVFKNVNARTKCDLTQLKPVNYIGSLKTPLFFLVGSNDTVISPLHSHLLYSKASGAKAIVEVRGGHNDPRPYRALTQALEFVSSFLTMEEEECPSVSLPDLPEPHPSPTRQSAFQSSLFDWGHLEEPLEEGTPSELNSSVVRLKFD